MTPALVDEFIRYLQSIKHLRSNTIKAYLSAFRSMYNQIVRETGYTPRFPPFTHVRLRTENTAKRAVSIEVMKEVARLDLRQVPELTLAADLCTFSFLACGMPFVDLVHLTRKNIEGNMLIYHRTKTRTLIRIEITSGMRHLLEKYASDSTPYLFPVLPPDKEVSHEQYKSLLRTYNKQLKEIGTRLQTPAPFTSYTIRHTWATEAHRHYIPIALISQALGHTSEKTTHCYLAQLELSELGKANATVVNTIDRLVVGETIP